MMELRKRPRTISYKEIDESQVCEEPQVEYDKEHYDISTYMTCETEADVPRIHDDEDEEDKLPEPDDMYYDDNEIDSDIPELDSSSSEDTTDDDKDDYYNNEAHAANDNAHDECREEEQQELNPHIPAPPFCTYNLNGISEGTKRSAYILNNVEKLTKTFQIIITQETKLPDNGHRFIQKRFPKWGVFHSAGHSGSAGVMIMISPYLL